MDSSGLILPSVSEIDITFRPGKLIRAFSEIIIDPGRKTLVLCDIDDTLLHHPMLNGNWLNIVQTYFFDNQPAFNKYVDELLVSRPMQHTDREGFFSLVERTTKFVFVTARFAYAKDFTYQNLKSIDVDPENMEVHFCGHKRKGEYIANNFDLEEYDSVIFIDDQQNNLETVYSFVNHPGLELYKFEYLREDPATYYPFPRGFPSWVRFDGRDLERIEGADMAKIGMQFL